MFNLKSFAIHLLALQVLLFTCMSGAAYGDSIYSTQTPGVSGTNTIVDPFAGKYSDTYFVDDFGNILMIVNVMGAVGAPGQVVVSDNADLPVIISRAGGFKSSANLNKVVLSRYRPDSEGKQSHTLNLKPYYDNGDRSAFLAVKPNDTIIVSEKGVDLISLLTVITLSVTTSLGPFSVSAYSSYSLYNLLFNK
jgi:hypothetical protein